jgi:hypothetical protein
MTRKTAGEMMKSLKIPLAWAGTQMLNCAAHFPREFLYVYTTPRSPIEFSSFNRRISN